MWSNIWWFYANEYIKVLSKCDSSCFPFQEANYFLHITIALTIEVEDFHVFICHINLFFPVFFLMNSLYACDCFYYSNVHIFLKLCRKWRTIILWKMCCLRNSQWNNVLALLLSLLYKNLAFPSSQWSFLNNSCSVLPDSNWYLLTWMPKNF